MTKLLLAPHNDDEALFASYTCLRHKPKVIVALLGGRKKNYAAPDERVAESRAAMGVLGCEFEQLPVFCDPADWDAVEEILREEPEPEWVWAPLPEIGGHRHHNRLGHLAIRLWPGRVSFYTTYTMVDDWPVRSVAGDPVPIEPGWESLKRQALACYPSQSEKRGTSMHFQRPLDEYVVPSLRLNLGSGPNPVPGMVNLDLPDWRFEDGLDAFPDESVEAITESHALMYVHEAHWPFVFSEIARVLKPGGTVRMTHDAIGMPGSGRPVIRPKAAVATTPEMLLRHLRAAELDAKLVDPDETTFTDRSLIQSNYGSPPDVFHVEATKTR